MKDSFLIVLVLPFFLNCATHAPMSEMVMFSPKMVQSTSINEDSVKFYYSRFSFGLSMEKNLIYYPDLRDYTESRYGKRAISEDSYLPSLGVNSIIMRKNNDVFALNLVTGLTTLGADLTVKVDNNFYLTYGHSFGVGNQLILQRRMHYNYNTGTSLGLFYDEFIQVQFEECYSICFGPGEDQLIPLKAIGIRGLWLATDGRKNRMFAKHTLKLGYILDYGSPYASFGFSFGMY